MTGHEIDGQLFAPAIVEELLDPDAVPLLFVDLVLWVEEGLLMVDDFAIMTMVGNEVACGWTAHLQFGTHSFER